MTNRKKRQAELLFKLGLVLRPLYDLVQYPENYDAVARSRAAGKFSVDVEIMQSEIMKFTSDDPGHNYQREWRLYHGAMFQIQRAAQDFLHDTEKLKTVLEKNTAELQEAILSIPALSEAVILEAHTPFSSYCLIKDLCQTSGQRLVLTDRYLTGTVYYRFLRDIPKSTQVILVTFPQTKRKAPEWADLIDISRMYAAERPNTYRLIANENFHDRWLWLDEQIFSLGGSLSEAGNKNDFTVTRLDPTPTNRQQIEDVVNSGTELYGSTQLVHP
jgi:hypothetical protein